MNELSRATFKTHIANFILGHWGVGGGEKLREVVCHTADSRSTLPFCHEAFKLRWLASLILSVYWGL